MRRSRTCKRGGQNGVLDAGLNAGKSALSSVSQLGESTWGSVSGFGSSLKQKVGSLFSNNGSNTGVSTFGGKRHHKIYRGGQVVRAYNTFNDPSTAYATPVSGYPTAMPQNFVGGKKVMRTRRRTNKNRRTRRRH